MFKDILSALSSDIKKNFFRVKITGVIGGGNYTANRIDTGVSVIIKSGLSHNIGSLVTVIDSGGTLTAITIAGISADVPTIAYINDIGGE